MRQLLMSVIMLTGSSAVAPVAFAQSFAEPSPLGESLKDIKVASHWIYDDYPRALAEAKSSGKPLMVVLRCVPCPPGRNLDTEVMQPDSELDAIQKHFVCLRIIQANSLDMDLFQYD